MEEKKRKRESEQLQTPGGGISRAMQNLPLAPYNRPLEEWKLSVLDRMAPEVKVIVYSHFYCIIN